MTNPYLLLAPGPVNIHPKVREALSEPMIHHRTPLFDGIFKRVKENIKKIFQTEQNCYLLTSTGSGGMECLMVNTLSVNDTVLIINSGKFGERWVQMAKAFNLNIIEHKVPWGEIVNPKDIEKILEANKMSGASLNNSLIHEIHSSHDKINTEANQIKAIFCQATETSTGVAHPIEELGKLISKYPDTLFLVDGITALGAYDLPMDKWHIDGLVGGSQKAFMLPTGMSFVSFSKKAWHKIPTANIPRYYYDIREEEKANSKGETWFSSNVANIKALDVVLNLILYGGLAQHFASIEKRALFTRHFGQKLGLSLATEHPSLSLTTLKVPADVDSQKIRTILENKYNITIMGGQDAWKGKVLRIGHMGYIHGKEMVHFFECLQLALEHESIPHNKVTTEEMQQWLQK
jgi:aspartate aminotransferase-like enzyme